MGGIMKLSGKSTFVVRATRGPVIDTGALPANSFVEIRAIGASTAFPDGLPVTGIFITPDASATAVTLAAGDEAYPLSLTRIAKTEADMTAEEGVIDVTDDAEGGYNSSILDGYKSLSGSLGGFLNYDESTGELRAGTKDILSRFFSVVTDDSAGVYTVTAAENNKLLLLICMNREAAVGEVQNWIVTPALISSAATGFGLKSAQSRDLSWTKAPGWAGNIRRTVGASDAFMTDLEYIE